VWKKHSKKLYWLILPLVIVAVYILKNYSPESYGFYLKCPLYTLTGWKCSGCGNQRAVHALLNGSWSEAWKANPSIYFLLPYLSAGLFLNFYSQKSEKAYQFYRKLYHPSILIGLFIGLIIFGILRNFY